MALFRQSKVLVKKLGRTFNGFLTNGFSFLKAGYSNDAIVHGMFHIKVQEGPYNIQSKTLKKIL